MKTLFKLTLIASFANLSVATAQSLTVQPQYFIANRGQIKDQFGHARKDIDFVYRAGKGLNIMVGRGKLSYYFNDGNEKEIRQHRVDMELKNINLSGAVIAEGGNDYVENYYQNGSEYLQVPAAERICYKNIYQGVDWVLYISEGKLEHEFIVQPNAQASAINWTYKGAENLHITRDGTLSWTSPLGTIREQAPQSFTGQGRPVASSYTQLNHTFQYQLSQSDNITIDPTVEWASYIGGSGGGSQIIGSCADQQGYLYVCGLSTDNANLASTGAFQTTLKGIGDGFLTKIDTAGRHAWTTYYGGEGTDMLSDVQFHNGFLYCSGQANSKTGISTPGVQQEIWGATSTPLLSFDAILVKFNTSGSRIWGTYCGGIRDEQFNNVAIDGKGDIYALGISASKSGIATPGAFQDTLSQSSPADSNLLDGILVKYNPDGKRIWGTYLGGFSNDYGQGLVVNGSTLFVSGNTNSNSQISTPSAYQTAKAAGAAPDAFLMKFDTSGKRAWGTYLGGNGSEDGIRLTCNSRGYAYIAGTTNSTSGIASTGAWKSSFGGIRDMFLAKFDPGGGLAWSTYFGGADDDVITSGYRGGRIVCDTVGDDNNVFIVGDTKSSGLATSDAFQKTLGSAGKYDAFFAAFNGSGALYYCTYYGGADNDYGATTMADRRNFFLTGTTYSSAGIATKGAYKDTLKNSNSGFIVKFKPGTPSSIEDKVINKFAMTISPNPSNGVLHISAQLNTDINEKVNLSVLNVAGKTVQKAETMVVDGKLDFVFTLFETLGAGLYTLRIESKAGYAVENFIKQ